MFSDDVLVYDDKAPCGAFKYFTVDGEANVRGPEGGGGPKFSGPKQSPGVA
jgi:hypothetical protein